MTFFCHRLKRGRALFLSATSPGAFMGAGLPFMIATVMQYMDDIHEIAGDTRWIFYLLCAIAGMMLGRLLSR